MRVREVEGKSVCFVGEKLCFGQLFKLSIVIPSDPTKRFRPNWLTLAFPQFLFQKKVAEPLALAIRVFTVRFDRR